MSSNTKDIIEKVKNITINDEKVQKNKSPVTVLKITEDKASNKDENYEGVLWLTGC